MPWKEETKMSLRKEFVQLALREDSNISELCRRYNISRKTGYKWLKRYRAQGESGLADRARRPHHSPNQTPEEVEEMIMAVRSNHPAWGGRKIKTFLERKGQTGLPSPSTITEVLRRHQLIDPEESQKRQAFQRFEMEHPNQLWQIDFKGHFPIGKERCHPLTVVDDHSRYLVGLQACPNIRRETVQEHLTGIFRRYGLPERMLMDNGPPWGYAEDHPFTVFTAWLIRLGIVVSHGRPYHPQTLGKNERLNRTLDAELLSLYSWSSLHDYQKNFNRWRYTYNFERPHEALEMAVPADIYTPSQRIFPEQLPPIMYQPTDIVRKVGQGGRIHFSGQVFRVGKAFVRHPVAIRPTEVDGDFEVFFCFQKIATISLHVDNGS